MPDSALNQAKFDEDGIPTQWLNVATSMPVRLLPPIDSNGNPIDGKDWEWLFSRECLEIELLRGDYGRDSWVDIPIRVLEGYKRYRPTPLTRAEGLEAYLGTSAEIYYKPYATTIKV